MTFPFGLGPIFRGYVLSVSFRGGMLTPLKNHGFSVARFLQQQLLDVMRRKESHNFHAKRLVSRTEKEQTAINERRVISYQYPTCSMYGIFTHMYHKFKPNVGKYSIHGVFGYSINM